MNKARILISCLTFIIAALACSNFSGLTETKDQRPEVEEQSQPSIPPTETALPTQEPTETPGPYDQIQNTLLSNPPCAGNQDIRKNPILTLNEDLKSYSASFDPEIISLYENMMDHAFAEFDQPVENGVRIWSIYNHGFIVKTPSAVFAFDLVHGYSGWEYRIPDEILDQIDVLFISHRHGDHRDLSVIGDILDFGGEVIMPAEDFLAGHDIVYLAPNEVVTVAGLHIKGYDGLHGSLANRIYVVTTPEGVRIMHTGDNQTSETLPNGVTVDILLLNAWVNESGGLGAEVGIPNCINKLTPQLTILGHIHELGHDYDPNSIYSRFSFDIPLTVAEMELPGEVSVQIWGERCDYPIE